MIIDKNDQHYTNQFNQLTQTCKTLGEKIQIYNDVQKKNKSEINLLNDLRTTDKSEFYDKLDIVSGIYNEKVINIEKRINFFDDALLDHKRHVRNQLEVLNGFESQINKNTAKIEMNTYIIEKT